MLRAIVSLANPTGMPRPIPEQPPPRNPRYLSLDLWRGVACLMVALCHASSYLTEVPGVAGGTGMISAILARLWAGVPLFFVISGYCIAATADSSRRRGVGLGQYFLRRFRRIYPPFWILLVLSVLVIAAFERLAPGYLDQPPHAIEHPFEIGIPAWIGNLTLTESWRYHLGGGPQHYLLGHAWTLCYEEQFYAVVGALLLVSRPRFFQLALALSVGVAILLGVPALRTHLYGFFLDGRWLLFASGMLVYWGLNYSTRAQRLAITALFAVMLLVISTRLGALSSRAPNLVQEAWVASLFALLLMVLHPLDARLATHRWMRPLMWCGLRCYSIYLAHFLFAKIVSRWFWGHGITGLPLTLAVVLPVAMAIILAASGLFYQLVEQRFLNSTPARAS